MGEGRVLVTGATGFVGRAVVAELLARSRPLTLATRRPLSEASAGTRVAVVGEIGPGTEWGEALADVRAVVHLAAHVHVAPERARREAGLFDAVNHRGSLRLFEAAAARGVETFVFVSSVTVLGSLSPPGGAFDDATAPRPETPYARSKLAAEDALARRAEAGGPILVVLRPPLVAGPGVGGNLASLARLAALPVPLPLGGIANRRTLLGVENLADAIAAVLAGPVAGRFLIGDATPLSTSDIVRALRAGAGVRMPVVALPPWLWRRAARLGATARRMFGDLALDSGGFRRTYGWSDRIATAETLHRTGAAMARRA